MGVDQAAEKLRKALDIRDSVARLSGEHDPFAHHVWAANVLEGAQELVAEELGAQFTAPRPNGERLRKAVDCKDRLAARGVRVSEEEALWQAELEEGLRELGA